MKITKDEVIMIFNALSYEEQAAERLKREYPNMKQSLEEFRIKLRNLRIRLRDSFKL